MYPSCFNSSWDAQALFLNFDDVISSRSQALLKKVISKIEGPLKLKQTKNKMRHLGKIAQMGGRKHAWLEFNLWFCSLTGISKVPLEVAFIN